MQLEQADGHLARKHVPTAAQWVQAAAILKEIDAPDWSTDAPFWSGGAGSARLARDAPERRGIARATLRRIMSRIIHCALWIFIAACSSSPVSGTSSGAGSSGSSSSSGNAPPTSGKPPVTLGPDIANPSGTENTFACSAGYPIQTNAAFPQPFYMEGAPSCTVLTFLAPTQPSPGDGVAVSASIRVGATTGPMRFVRMRILYQAGRVPPQECCSVEQYGDTFTPTANTTSTVPLGFAMVEDHIPADNDINTIAKNDVIALEVLDASVPIPGFWPANGGAVQGTASYIYFPALSAQKVPAPSPTLVNYSGSYSGFVPSFTISYVPN